VRTEGVQEQGSTRETLRNQPSEVERQSGQRASACLPKCASWRWLLVMDAKGIRQRSSDETAGHQRLRCPIG